MHSFTLMQVFVCVSLSHMATVRYTAVVCKLRSWRVSPCPLAVQMAYTQSCVLAVMNGAAILAQF